jgi:hypothetical protein
MGQGLGHPSLAEIKRRVQAGSVYDVTNHYIQRPDHPSFGTQRREVMRVSASRFYLSHRTRPDGAPVDWPKAAQVQMDDDGTIRLYGGGVSQGPDDLFLTLVPVRPEGAEVA